MTSPTRKPIRSDWGGSKRAYVRPVGERLGSARSLTARDAEAIEAARAYTGAFSFMLDMRRKASQPGWVPTEKQATAILNCARRKVASL